MRTNVLCGLNRALFVAVVFLLILPGGASAQKRTHSVFFEGTDYELNVYRIYGKTPGKTLLLIGGIQGDEPGGYLSVDHYADISLAKGNLIVVPRANFRSILLNRRMINEDMNRKFSEDIKSNYETKIVAILKKLICGSDCLLNLHDGSGFFSKTWEGPNRNPKRYGQSIIADCETYANPKTGKTIRLGDMAETVSARVNRNIENPRYHFQFNNHKTKEKDSLHKEQRKSATYFALYRCGIPAFGIETSKSLPLEMKVRHHNLAINAFMDILDIVPETPGINLDPPVLHYLVVSINDSLPVVVKNKQTLYVAPDDKIEISHIEANYNRGLSADVVGHGTIQDMRKQIRITRPTRIIVRKDYFACGNVYIAMGKNQKKQVRNVSVSGNTALNDTFLFYKVRINDREQIFGNNAHVRLIKGDTFQLVDVTTSYGDPSALTVNFKGFVGDKKDNTGEDRGYVIHTARDLWKRYSLRKKGKHYQVITTIHDETVGRLFVDLEDPVLRYVILGDKDGTVHCLESGDADTVRIKEPFTLLDIITNVEGNLGIQAFVTGPGSYRQRVVPNEPIAMTRPIQKASENASRPCRIEIERDSVTIGFIQFRPCKQEIQTDESI